MNSKLIHSKLPTIHHFQLENKVFLAAQLSPQGEASGILLPNDFDTRKNLAATFKELSSDHGQKPDLIYKVIGAPEFVHSITEELKKMGLPVKASFPHPGPIDVYLNSKDDRLKVSKTDRLESKAEGIEIVGTAEKPYGVVELVRANCPDVITLAIYMPEMNGVQLLKRLLPDYAIPPVLDALGIVGPLIIEKVKNAARSKVIRHDTLNASKSQLINWPELDTRQLVVIGSSTGGTEALKSLLTQLPRNIPAVFSRSFADRMNELCPFEVREAADGDSVTPNLVLIAAGGTQMRVVGKSGNLSILVDDGPSVNRHKPSVDGLFDSAAQLKKKSMIGIILTGMGSDGAEGLLKLNSLGVHTIAQDEASCVVFGMPKAAIKLGAVELVSPLLEIPKALAKGLKKDTKKTA